LDKLTNWILDNKEWLFSGIGVLILILIGRFIKGKQAESSQSIRSKNDSTNIQAGRDVRINSKPKDNDVEEEK